MPCINNNNGQPVPGVQGQCPIGSTWRHPNGAEIEAMKVYDLPKGSYGRDDEGTSTGELTPGWFGRNRMSDKDISRINQEFSVEGMMNRQPLMDQPDWMPDWGVDAGILAAGVIGGGRGGGNKKSMLEALKRLGGRLGNLYKSKASGVPGRLNPLKKTVQNPIQYKNVKPKWNKIQKQWEFQGRKINPKTWNKGRGMNSSKKVRVGLTRPAVTREWSPFKVGAAGLGTAYMGGTALMDKMNQPEKRFMSTAEQYQQTAGQQKPPRELSDWEKQFAKFKDPKFWTESISGLPHDSRMHRMGMLMDYYGKTPKQRAAVDMPSEVWAENEAAAQKNQTAILAAQIKAKNDAMTFLSKISDKTQQDALRKDVEEKLDAGFIGGIPGFNPDKSEIDEAVAEVALNIQNLMQTRDMSYANARELVLNAFTK